MKNNTLELLVSKNIKSFSPDNILSELDRIKTIFKNYVNEVNEYINNLGNIIIKLNIFYRNIYNLCLKSINGINLFSNTGYLIIIIMRYVQNIKSQWVYYHLRLNVFYNNLNKYTSQFLSKT
jgi:hypothetical protein